jgi:hypothetical protein
MEQYTQFQHRYTDMLKTAATKIAHNSTIPALAGNKDLRPLQDLITAEKAVIVSSVSIHIMESCANSDSCIQGCKGSALTMPKPQKLCGYGGRVRAMI